VARSDLIRWLGSLGPGDLAGLLTRRPDVTAKRAPRDLTDLADLLMHRVGVATVVSGLPRPAIEIIEALQALLPPPAGAPDDGVDRARLAAVFGREPDDPELDATLQVLAQRALAWSDGDQVYLLPTLHRAFESPLGLGRPGAELFDVYPVTELRQLAKRLGLPGTGTKAEIGAAVAAWLAEPEHVAGLLKDAPGIMESTLTEIANGPPVLDVPLLFSGSDPVFWAVAHGLLVNSAYDLLEMPREVGLAIRGANWRAEFHAVPPSPRLTPIDPAAVRGEAGNAASDLLDRLAALVEECGKAPAAILRTGGVGVRELRRLAKAVGVEEEQVRFLLEVATAAELIAPGPAGHRPTAAFKRWRAKEPAKQLATVLPAWYAMPAITLDGSTDPALLIDDAGPLAVALRPVLLQALDELPPSTGITDTEAFFSLVRWSAPIPLNGIPEPDDLLDGLWNEMVAVGACAHGAISPLGRALVEGTPVVDAAGRMLRSVVGTARFLGDLTAIVGGVPAPEVREILDASADREARGAASIWRFSPGSIRRALDGGLSTVDLLARLRGVAVDGQLPQPLEYLVNDIGRQHGSLRIRAVGCIVYADDADQVAALVGARALSGLALTQIAPTVLASAATPDDTLQALRKAGYAPSIDGATIAVEPTSRPPQIETSTPRTSTVDTVDPAALARKLLAARTPVNDDTYGRIAKAAPQLSERARRLLASAVEQGTMVRIDYTDTKGQVSTRVIEQAVLDGRRLEAWCHLREDERAFQLDRIAAVYPV
jgi:Helicase conserved C-terminal domain